MKGKLKIISTIAIVALAFGLCSCGAKNENIQKTEVTTSQSIANNTETKKSTVDKKKSNEKATTSKSNVVSKQSDSGKSTVINKHYHENKYIYNNDVKNNKTENNISNNVKVEEEINNTQNNIKVEEEINNIQNNTKVEDEVNVDIDNNEINIDSNEETNINKDSIEVNEDENEESNDENEENLIITKVEGAIDEIIISFIKEKIGELDSKNIEFLELQRVENLSNETNGKVLYAFYVVDGGEESSAYYYDEEGCIIYKVTGNTIEILEKDVKVLEAIDEAKEIQSVEENEVIKDESTSLEE